MHRALQTELSLAKAIALAKEGNTWRQTPQLGASSSTVCTVMEKYRHEGLCHVKQNMNRSAMGRYVLRRRIRIRRNFVGFVGVELDIVVVSFVGFTCGFFYKG